MTKPQNNLQLPEGFSSRPARLTDAAALETLFNAVSMKVEGVQDFSENEIKVDLQSPGFDLEQDSLVIENPENQIVAYQEMMALGSLPVHPGIWGRVHPDYMKLGLGTQLLQWAVARAQTVPARVPSELRVSAISWNKSDWQPGEQLLLENGFKPIRFYFDMKIEMDAPPPRPVLAAGLRMDTYSHPEEAEAVYHAIEDAFQDHFGYVEQTFEEGFERFQHYRFKDEGFDPSLWFLVKDGDTIAGFSLCRKWSYESKDEGFVNILGVKREYRKKGLGLALLHHSFNAYWDRGMKSVALGVDGSSLTGAVRLYERAGMKVHKQFNSYELELRPGKEIRTE